MSRNKEREILWNKFKTDRYREWQTKYPGLKQQTYISFETAKKIGLPLKQGDTTDKSNKNQRKRRAKHKKQYSDRNRKFVNRYKKLLGCTLCGWNKSTWGLHFDHINPHDKTTEISKMMSASRREIKKEIRKCRLVCANCHSIHTEQQHHSKKYGWHLGGKKEEFTLSVQLELKL